jgi:hypothetical protein
VLVAWCTVFALAPPPRHSSPSNVSYWFGFLLNELPFVAFYWLLASTLIFVGRNDIDTAVGWVAFGVAGARVTSVWTLPPAYTCCNRMMNFFLKASANEVVPMLRRMEAEVAAGRTVQEAYAAALHETKMLKLLVGEPAPGLPFGTALLEGATKSRIRPLAELAASLRPESGVSTAQRSSRRQKSVFIAGVAVGALVVVRLLRR